MGSHNRALRRIGLSSAVAIAGVGFDPLRDKSYRLTRLGGPIVDYLASKENLGRRATTLDDKERYLAAFALMWPQLELADVDTKHCVHWLAAQPASCRRPRRSHLNDFFNWAIRWDMIDKNPLRRLEPMPQQRQKVYDTFSEAEVAALTSLPAVDGTLMEIMFGGGLRKSECIALQTRHIIIDAGEDPRGQLRVLNGKGNKDRLVDMPRRLSRRVAEYQLVEGMGPKSHFWYTKPGGKKIRRTVPMVGSSFQTWWVRCLADADVRYRNPHMTRHTYAENWLRKGGRLETLKEQMGHESIATTYDMYGHLDRRDIIRDLELIEG